MSSPLPRPVPLEPAAEEVPQREPAPPSALRVVTLVPADDREIGFVYKRTYDLDTSGRPSRLSEEQPPLDEEGGLHDPLSPDAQPSFKSLPEVIAFKTGTDVVIRGSARPPQPVREWAVWARVGPYVQSAHVYGTRICERVNGAIRFSPPQIFEEMPLRLENAYGGRDVRYERELMREVAERTPPEQLRRAKPSLEAIFGANHPLMYPRNRFGKGYVLDPSPANVEGRELPNLERPDDLLTPERLVLPHPLDWTAQPVPAAFDYIDPFTFPRSAMLGFPPPSARPLDDDLAEVKAGLIPSGYCRGNVFARPPQQMIDCLHPWSTRCAPPGLALPFLRGDEVIILNGMDADRREVNIPLPREIPEFTFPAGVAGSATLVGQLHLAFVDVDARRLTLIWSARTSLTRTLLPGQTEEIAAASHLRMIGF